MIKQTQNLAKGIVSPPKSNKSIENNPPQHFRDKIAHSISKGERRARERSHTTLREVCKGCSRPFNLCLCEVLNATAIASDNNDIHTNVIVLQHPNEFRKKHTSTVPLLRLVLGDENVQIKVGYDFTMNDILLTKDDADDYHRPLMLFPGPDAIELDEYVFA